MRARVYTAKLTAPRRSVVEEKIGRNDREQPRGAFTCRVRFVTDGHLFKRSRCSDDFAFGDRVKRCMDHLQRSSRTRPPPFRGSRRRSICTAGREIQAPSSPTTSSWPTPPYVSDGRVQEQVQRCARASALVALLYVRLREFRLDVYVRTRQC
jgi:hypothetical protein